MVNNKSLYERFIEARKIQKADLETSLDDLPDESSLSGIDLIGERIRDAVYSNEPTIIFGHDDPDGITGTYILYKFLNDIGFQGHSYYIPNRNLESHGIQDNFVNFVRNNGYKLVITVDNGISAKEGVRKLNDLGCDVVITDHHLIQETMLPDAYAIMNPHLPECNYPFKSLAGVGVALMLIRYLSRQWDQPIDPASYFWAAVGSIADKVPMIGINRVLIRHVLENFEDVQDQTVQFLLRNYSRVDSQTEIFNFITYTSRLIANGREENGQHSALSFINQLSDAKAKLFERLEEEKNLWESELNRVFGFLDTLTEDFVGNYFVYYDDDGVIPYALLGTAATYVVNRLGIPTIMLKQHNSLTVCEGRCKDGFNMVEAFSHCKEHLIQFGGHAKAAGFSMEHSSYDSFLECFNTYLNEHYLPPVSDSDMEYDTECLLEEMDSETWKALEAHLPWGQNNPEPILKVKKLRVADLSGAWNLDSGSLHLSRDECKDCLVMWRSQRLIRILKILDD
nr:single-stranded-DNA-specific exonuclease [Candidatus Cloacimonadota bacterium]